MGGEKGGEIERGRQREGWGCDCISPKKYYSETYLHRTLGTATSFLLTTKFG